MKRLVWFLFVTCVTALLSVSSAFAQCNIDNTPPTGTEGSSGPLYCNTDRELFVSAASGAATETKQDTIITHLTTLISGLLDAIGTTFPTSVVPMGASDGTNTQALRLDGSGNLNVNIAAGGAAGGTSSTFGAALPATGTAVGFEDSGGNMAAVVLEADGSLPITIKAGAGAGGTSATDDDVFTAATGAGTPIMGFVTTDDVSAGDVGVVGMTDDRALHVNLRSDDGTEKTSFAVTGPLTDTELRATAVPVSGTVTANAGTSPTGCTIAKTLSAASTNATSVKGSAGTLCSLTVINTTATIYYLKWYNKATAATCNSDTVLQNIPIPASTDGAGVSVDLGPYGWAFTTGITFCLTGALADNDNTSAATGVAINYSYK